MMLDKKTKALLLAIALGLWANVAIQWFRPNDLHAQNATQARIEDYLSNIDQHVEEIASGTCTNDKIC